jgi:hypothetical protein
MRERGRSSEERGQKRTYKKQGARQQEKEKQEQKEEEEKEKAKKESHQKQFLFQFEDLQMVKR